VKLSVAIAASVGAIAVAGCANSAVGVRTGALGGSAPAPGGSQSAASIRVQANPNAYFGALLLGSVAIGVHDTYLRGGEGSTSREPPQLDPDRSIVERDCSLPMETPSANLRCK